MPNDEKEFVEMPTLTMSPVRKKGLPRGVLIFGAAIMLIGLAIIVMALMSSGG